VLKFNSNLRYTTDGVSAAIFRSVCQKAEVPVQTYYNRADLPGGSTLGNISLAHVSVLSADIGLAQLAMHSCYETSGTKDIAYLVRAMESFYGASLEVCNDGSFCLK
jgi:aspartyl aminopeptidase